jgi:pimeloyl-ACP methyl ester carboxylesterase
MAMANFEVLEDGTIRPWLTLDRHMMILRALWEQKPSELYPDVVVPTLVAVAGKGGDEKRRLRKEREVAAAESVLPTASVFWFEDSGHDIHMEQPEEFAEWMLGALKDGFFA